MSMLDTVVSERSCVAARHAAGGAVELVGGLLTARSAWGASLHRPPGHHADARPGHGLLPVQQCRGGGAVTRWTNVACERVLILDWDVHHGNGTNDIFHDSDRVLFVSIHQSPLYPGTGPARDVGSGAGTGYTVNLPVASGSGDAVFVSLVEHVVRPAGAAPSRPSWSSISAGYDAHRDDPLADCAVTEAGYAAMTRAMRGVAGELQAPLGIVLEGGYSLAALGRSVRRRWPRMQDVEAATAPPARASPEAAAARERLARGGRTSAADPALRLGLQSEARQAAEHGSGHPHRSSSARRAARGRRPAGRDR